MMINERSSFSLLPTASDGWGKVLFTVCPHLVGGGYSGRSRWGGTLARSDWWGTPARRRVPLPAGVPPTGDGVPPGRDGVPPRQGYPPRTGQHMEYLISGGGYAS